MYSTYSRTFRSRQCVCNCLRISVVLDWRNQAVTWLGYIRKFLIANISGYICLKLIRIYSTTRAFIRIKYPHISGYIRIYPDYLRIYPNIFANNPDILRIYADLSDMRIYPDIFTRIYPDIFEYIRIYLHMNLSGYNANLSGYIRIYQNL